MGREIRRTQMMSVDDVAQYLGMHPVTVYRFIKETDIPVFKLKGKWRFKRDILDDWLEKRMKRRTKLRQR